MSQNPVQPPSNPDPDRPEPQTLTGQATREILQNIWEPLDEIGYALMGDLWRTVYLSIQDALALGVLLQLPSLVGRVIIGKDFSSFDVCQKENWLGVSFWACHIIVILDFCL